MADQLSPAPAATDFWRRFLVPLFGPGNRVNQPPIPMTPLTGHERFRLWIDAVGGFLVCLGDEITLGQALPDAAPDVPIIADLSRRHAVIRRDAEGYVIEPVRPVKIDGRTIDQPTTLADGRFIELGSGVRLRFRRPHPLSATARLEFVSHHRTQPALDAVLLMAETCVLGPGAQSHIVARELAGDVVLFRQGNGLSCRSNCGPIQIDGAEAAERGPLTPQSRVQGQDFCFTLESC